MSTSNICSIQTRRREKCRLFAWHKMTRINQYSMKKIKSKPRSENIAIQEIRHYQKSTKLLIPKRSFEKLVQEIARNMQ